MGEHATVKIGEYIIPLIGIPLSATEMECDLCHDIFHITEVELNEAGTQFLCSKHREHNKNTFTQN